MRASTHSEPDDPWLDRIGPQGVWHRQRLMRWRVAMVCPVPVCLILLMPAARAGWAGGLYMVFMVIETGCAIAGTRHSRWVERDVAARFGLSARASWLIHIDTPERFDVSILKLQARRDDARTAEQ